MFYITQLKDIETGEGESMKAVSNYRDTQVRFPYLPLAEANNEGQNGREDALEHVLYT